MFKGHELSMTTPSYPNVQTSLLGPSDIDLAIVRLAESAPESRGAIFTRPEVVNFILDLVGYKARENLSQRRILEPAFGEGDFLVPVVERLMTSFSAFGGEYSTIVERLKHCVHGAELHADSLQSTANKLRDVLVRFDVPDCVAGQLIDAWLYQGDFLLRSIDRPFTHVVGNPPYLRQEAIPNVLLAEYRRRYHTIYDRADLYVPFIEKSLKLLQPGGTLGFICADRWMKNKYGQRLRKMVANSYRLKAYVDMVDTQAFKSDVTVYPAIFVVSAETGGSTSIALRPKIEQEGLLSLADRLSDEDTKRSDRDIHVLPCIGTGTEPWLLDRPEELAFLRKLESRYPTIEEVGCKVGIGVATGADSAFIGPYADLDVERSRKLPLVMTRDIDSGEIKSCGAGVVNPFRDQGGLVDLDDYPRLKRYFQDRKEKIAGRHISKKSPQNWYRTIDRIYPELARTRKLLIPDIKGDAHIVYENGKFYPHHNLYYITSTEWDLRALQAVLKSGLAKLFVSLYSTTMRGGYLRFQAQYIRRIRVPAWKDVSSEMRRDLCDAGKTGNLEMGRVAVRELFGLSDAEQMLLDRS